MSTKPIDCEQALRHLFEFLDRELDAHDHEAMQQHLHTCKSCFSRVEFERRLKERFSALRQDDPTPAVSGRIQSLLKRL
ncbi:MAG: zf-HC2 domain-containing protein [Burkholderiales bacterium]|nr:MAG: zf-HC2 domain-containing protein [Burkholderiales bacterium]